MKKPDGNFEKLVHEHHAVNPHVCAATTRLDRLTNEEGELLRRAQLIWTDELLARIKA
jgi:uncharacterized protein YdcH (DUF465 family)